MLPSKRLDIYAHGRDSQSRGGRQSAQANLKIYAAELPLGSLAVGVDNIHHDVYLSPIFTEQTRLYLLELIRQTANLTYSVEKDSRTPKVKPPETGAWKRQILELLQASLTRAKYEKKIELDMLLRVSLIKFLTQEISAQFANLLLEAKEWIRNRGEYFERSEQAHVMKARLAELQGRPAQHLSPGGPAHLPDSRRVGGKPSRPRAPRSVRRRASGAYEMLSSRIAFVEGGRDDTLFLEQYVLLGNYSRDLDRFETIDALLLEFLREDILGGQGGPMNEVWSRHRELVNSAHRIAHLARRNGSRARRPSPPPGTRRRNALPRRHRR